MKNKSLSIFLLAISFYLLNFSFAQELKNNLPDEGTYFIEVYSLKEETIPIIDEAFFEKIKLGERLTSERREIIYDKSHNLRVVLLSREELEQGYRVAKFSLIQQ